MSLPRPHVARFGLVGLVGLVIALAPAAPARAQAFADFNDISTGASFAATNNGGTSLALNGTAEPVSFNYDSSNAAIYSQIATHYPTLLGTQAATVAYTALTTAPATTSGGSVTQSFNGPMIIQFLLKTPVSGKSDLLTATISPGVQLMGSTGAGSAALLGSSAGSPPVTISFTSDFFNAGAPITESLSVALSGLSVPLSVGPGGFVNSFTASQNGSFSAFYAVPVPASLVMLSTPRIFSRNESQSDTDLGPEAMNSAKKVRLALTCDKDCTSRS